MQLKNRLVALLLSLTMLVSLCGCGIYDALHPDCSDLTAQSIYNAEGANRARIVPFDEMEYARPDIDALKAKVEEVETLLDTLFKFREVIEGLNEFFAMYTDFYTMLNLASLRHDIDTEDEFYAEENSFCNEAAADVEYWADKLKLACSGSYMFDYLDENYFDGTLSEYYSADDGTGYTPTDEIAELERRETELENDYSELYTKYGEDFDDGSYKEHSDELGKIYVELIKVRKKLAELHNEPSYQSLAYIYRGHDYTAEDIASYTEAIKKYIVPLHKKAIKDGLMDARLLKKMKAAKAFDTMKDTVRGLDTRIAEALDYMLKYKLYNVESSDKKYDQSYVQYLSGYDSPFLYCNPSGNSSSILSMAHEFGHYVDGYLNYGQNDSIDTSELFSEAMEFLLLCNLEDDDLTKYQLISVLTLYACQGSYNEFEERAYALSDDELSVDKLNSLFGEIAKEYGLDKRIDEYEAYWISIPHLFNTPFYVISYCLSDTAAFELYNMELNESGSGLRMYMKLLDESTNYEFLELLDKCGVPSAISADTVKSIADTLADKLGI